LAEDAEICMAHNGERTQPVFSLMKVSLLPSMKAFLQGGERKIDKWYAQHRTVEADFSDQPRAFINMNAPEDIREAESQLNRRHSA
jgi:molybdopterin-guanine dinucleotide biosynthesis protein A